MFDEQVYIVTGSASRRRLVSFEDFAGQFLIITDQRGPFEQFSYFIILSATEIHNRGDHLLLKSLIN